ITTIDPPNSTFTIAQAINPVGQIVGYYLDGSGIHGFLRQPSGAITSFNVSRDGFQLGTFATAINPAGQITGYYDTLFFTTHSFLRQPDGTITLFFVNSDSTASTALGSAPLSFFTGDGDAPVGINQAGQIAGVWGNARYRSFLRQRDGTVTTFGVIPEMGIESTQAQAINSTCQIAGYYLGADSTYHGFLRQPDGSITTFDAPGAGTGSNQGTFAQAINPAGKITGYYIAADNTYHGFVRSQ